MQRVNYGDAKQVIMLESKIWKEAEQKSKAFLRSVMGDAVFNKFIEEGKVEIQSGNVTYELYNDGRVINKTSNQKYCIVPDRSDYPSYDILAIKFAWLKYGQETVDRVANKTNIETIRPVMVDCRGQQGNIASYAEFVHYMESNRWTREQVTVDELTTHLISTNSVRRGTTGPVISIRCPAGRTITIMGINQVPSRDDIRSAYSVILKIVDENDVEINGDTSIIIEKVNPSESTRTIVRGPYSLFNLTRQVGNDTYRISAYKTDEEWYRWRSDIHLMSEGMLRINVINSPVDICRENIKMSMDMDLWMRYH